jgi:GNAT superfamily N-acetyltransferase
MIFRLARRLRRGPLRFDPGYRECAKLANGATVYFRLLRRRDSSLLVQMFDQLSPETRYQRFFAHKQALSPVDLRTLTDCDGENHVAIAAVTKAGKVEGCVGIARFVRLREDPLTAEIALTVVDAHQRKGIGRLLLRRLIEAATERGIRQLQCFILAGNLPMITLVRQFAPEAQQRCVRLPGATVSTLTFRLPLRCSTSA